MSSSPAIEGVPGGAVGRDTACDACGALPGAPCVTKWGDKAYGNHLARRKWARKQNLAAEAFDQLMTDRPLTVFSGRDEA